MCVHTVRLCSCCHRNEPWRSAELGLHNTYNVQGVVFLRCSAMQANVYTDGKMGFRLLQTLWMLQLSHGLFHTCSPTRTWACSNSMYQHKVSVLHVLLIRENGGSWKGNSRLDTPQCKSVPDINCLENNHIIGIYEMCSFIESACRLTLISHICCVFASFPPAWCNKRAGDSWETASWLVGCRLVCTKGGR